MNCPYLQNALSYLQSFKFEILKQKSLGYVLLLSIGINLLFGFAVFLIDPNVHSFGDGVWLAWVTMTHVGYGDVVPTSFLGRTLACLLILFGLVMLALLTATFSTILLGRDMGGMAKDESKILEELKRLHDRLNQLESSQLHYKTNHHEVETFPPHME